MEQGRLSKEHYQRMHPILSKNYENYVNTSIPLDILLSALKKDKKNKGDMLGLIFPVGDNSDIQRVYIPSDVAFVAQCKTFLSQMGEE